MPEKFTLPELQIVRGDIGKITQPRKFLQEDQKPECFKKA